MYFDHAATTPMDPRLLPLFEELALVPLNPSSIHQSGQKARRILEDARERLAAVLGFAAPHEIVFTSGATESANLALRGLAEGREAGAAPLRVLSSVLEHSCVRDTVADLAKDGLIRAEEMPVGPDGRAVLPESGEADVLCLMHANNETGVVQDVAAAEKLAAGTGAVWICDVSQTVGKRPLKPSDGAGLRPGIAFLSGHKFGGPAGIGAVAGPAVSRLRARITGGPQEDERRAGTQAVALAACMARAAELAEEERDARMTRLEELENVLSGVLTDKHICFTVNGDGDRLPGFLNLSLKGITAADAVIALDQIGLRVSPGSACSTGVVSVSPVLEAMYPDDPARAAGGIRISFGHSNTPQEAEALGRALCRIAGQEG